MRSSCHNDVNFFTDSLDVAPYILPERIEHQFCSTSTFIAMKG